MASLSQCAIFRLQRGGGRSRVPSPCQNGGHALTGLDCVGRCCAQGWRRRNASRHHPAGKEKWVERWRKSGTFYIPRARKSEFAQFDSNRTERRARERRTSRRTFAKKWKKQTPPASHTCGARWPFGCVCRNGRCVVNELLLNANQPAKEKRGALMATFFFFWQKSILAKKKKNGKNINKSRDNSFVICCLQRD